jgi:hypothetical protein
MSEPAARLDRSTVGPSRSGRVLLFLKAHPILCLALLTPGIPEYLSTSSSLLTLVTSPPFFFLQLGINVGQYTAGALLIREAALRWKKGWASVFVLGLAYGIVEEGLGDNTLFNSNHGADGVLGSFGRFGGVNWVWATGVLAFHVIYSVGLPLLLLGLALPETRGRSLLGDRGIALALLSLTLATSLETTIVFGVFHYWMGPTLLVGATVTVILLLAVAYKLPKDLLSAKTERPSLGTFEAWAVGFAFFPIAFFLEYGFTGRPIPPSAIILVELLAFGALLERIRRRVGQRSNEYLLVHLAFGFIAWQAVFGFLLTLGLPYTLMLDPFVVWFFLRLRRAYAPRGTESTRVI